MTPREIFTRNETQRDVEVKGMSLRLLLTKQRPKRPKSLLYRDRTFETQNVSTCMTQLNSRCITCPPFFGPFPSEAQYYCDDRVKNLLLEELKEASSTSLDP